MLFFFVLAAAGLAFKTGLGTLCDLGYGAISAICPLGALETALAGRTFPLRTLISLAAVILIIAALGRFFCAWVCPAPIFRGWILGNKKNAGDAVPPPETAGDAAASSEIHPRQGKLSLDSRHFVLGGALLSSAIFGFPVFCLVCPVGLVLATFIGVWRLIQYNEPSWMLLIFPAIFILEIVICSKWCRKICPLGALLSLLSGLNPLFRPRVNRSVCRYASEKTDCSYCKSVCEESIDLHHSEKSRPMAECTKCRDCADVCPNGAISFPLFSKKPTDLNS
jgi:ferredoxin-type protein NapH